MGGSPITVTPTYHLPAAWWYIKTPETWLIGVMKVSLVAQSMSSYQHAGHSRFGELPYEVESNIMVLCVLVVCFVYLFYMILNCQGYLYHSTINCR
jgi:hypothetical protein